MKKRSLIVSGIVACTGLAGCHTDPFSIKPEANVTLPEKPADAEQAEDTAEADAADEVTE